MPDPEDLSGHLDAFVRHNWLSFAAAAWRNYMKFGRGYTLFDWKAIESWRQGGRFTLQPPYVTDAGHDQANAIIARYDPETSIVVGVTTDVEAAKAAASDAFQPPAEVKVIRQGESLGVWIYSYQPPPPAAHEKASH